MSGARASAGVLEQGGARVPQWMNNIAIIRATTTNAGDSIKITGANGTALSTSNYGWITLNNPATPGQLSTFSVTADVTILLTGAHWGIGTTGDITGGILRVLAINDNGTLRWGVALLGGRTTLLTTDTNATQTNVNLPEEVLCTAAVGSATNYCREVGYFRANFDDTGGAAEDLWAVQSGVGDVVTGETADGLWKPWNPTYSGFAVAPTVGTAKWTQIGRAIFASLYQSGAGTSNSTTTTVNLPAKFRFIHRFSAGSTVDNGSSTTAVALIASTADLLYVDMYKDMSGAAWTNANGKKADFNICYEVGPVASFIE